MVYFHVHHGHVRCVNYRITYLTHTCPICAAKLAPILSSIIAVTIDDNNDHWSKCGSKNQFPSQKKISGNSRPSSISSTVPRRVFSQRETLVQETRTGKTSMQRMAYHVAKYFVPAVIFIAISAGVGWYFVGVTGVSFSVTGVSFSLLSFFSVIILAIVLVLLVLLVLQHWW